MKTFTQRNSLQTCNHTRHVTSAIQQQKLMKAREVGYLLGISISKAYALMASGEIPAVRIGRCVRVQPLDLKAYIDERTTR